MPVSRPALFLAVLLLVLGALRIGALVAHEPVLAYANQFDTGRTSACIGLWPDLPGEARYGPHREAPAARYVEGPQRFAECYPSTELVLAAASIAAWRGAVLATLSDGRAMDARWLGAIAGIALVLLASLFTIALREHPSWMIAHAAAFALVLADPLVTLWMNTLYTEFAAVLCTYAAAGCLMLACCVRPDRAKWWAGLVLALAGLGMSRLQHAFLPLFFALLALTIGWHHRRGWSVAVVAVAIAAVVMQTVVIARAPTIRAANSVDVVLGTLLPASRAPERALATLSLPERCAGVIGATWYVKMGEDLSERCPEAGAVSPIRALVLLASEPSIVVRVLAKAAPLTRTLVLRYVGVRAGERFGTLESEPSPELRSLAPWLERLPLVAHVGWQMFLFALLPLALSVWVIRGARGAGSAGPLVMSALAGTFCYAILTTVLGDGYVEVARHAHLGIVAALALLVIVVVASLAGMFTHELPRIVAGAPIGQPTSLEFKLSVAAVALAVAMTSMVWWPAYRKLPLAVGVVDEPQSNRIASPRVVLHGWTLGPISATHAYALVEDATLVQARGWRHPTDPAGLEIARVFPYYADPATARFEIALDLTPLGGRPARVRTYAVDADDVSTEIDRRVLAPRGR